MKPEELAPEWIRKAEWLERAESPLAPLLRLCAQELAAALEEEAGELLTLEQAAQESRYRKDSLTRRVRKGQLQNRGKKHAPRFRRGDLPAKPPDLTPATLMRILPSRKSS